MGLEQLQNTKVYLDSNVFIYFIEDVPEFRGMSRALFRQIGKGGCSLVTSELTRAECLVHPMKNEDEFAIGNYKQILQTSQTKEVCPVSADVLDRSAHIRAMTRNSLPDSIHMATALSKDCAFFITNDKRIKSIAGIEILILSELA